MTRARLIIGCDDAAFDFKNAIIEFLRSKKYEVHDMGIASPDEKTFYPHIAEKVALRVLEEGKGTRGILFCGTGIGMAIAANKVPGIRAAQVHDAFSAERAALSNDANIITMGARVIGLELAKRLLMIWLPLEYKPSESGLKIEAIHEVEKHYSQKCK